jgi:hypothetical protein
MTNGNPDRVTFAFGAKLAASAGRSADGHG